MKLALLLVVALGLYLWLSLPATLRALYKAGHSLAIDSLSFADHDIVFLAGGWGAADDMGRSKALGDGIRQAWAADKVVGGVCHGPLGLLLASDTNGVPLVAGKRLPAVTYRQVAQLEISKAPRHPERELRAAGAVFENASAWLEPFANRTVVDGRPHSTKLQLDLRKNS